MIAARWRTPAACAAVAVLSLPVRAAMAYDPTSWLVWGRELGRLELDTTGGPSWKPLPVLITTVVAGLGDLAPWVWLAVARALAVFAFVLVFRLAARFAGPVAGAIAAAALVLTPDGGPRLLRLVAEGHAEPMGVTFGLWAIERHLDGRRDHAVLLGIAFALLRPECWPFLGVYAVWLWFRDPPLRTLLLVALPVIPLLWFGGDWVGSGSPLHGADAARVAAGDDGRAGLALERAWEVVVVPVWVAAAAGLVTAHRRGERALLAMGAGAVVWSALVAAMTIALGYAALSRFFLPAAGLLCVVAGVGAVRVVGGRAPIAVAAAAICLPLVLPRLLAIDDLGAEVAERHRLDHGLDVVIERAGGRASLLGCGRIALEPSRLPTVALAWKLDIALSDAGGSLRRRPGVYVALSGGRQDVRLGSRAGADRLAASDEWVVYAVDCDAPDLS